MTSFADQRPTVRPGELVGPRVYSTDLVANPNDLTVLDDVARSIKIKLVTKGTIVLNGMFLVSPIGVALMEKHPDLLSGPGIIPAFRTDHGSLHEQAARFAPDLEAAGMKGRRIDDHVLRLEDTIDRVMPWELADVGSRLRSRVVDGLRNPDALVSRQLAAAGVAEADRSTMADEIEGLDMTQSDPLRSYASGRGGPVGDILRTYVTTWYHRVGVEVVECETGTDLHPLSVMKADDMLLALRDHRAPVLDEAAVFRDQFVAYALDAIQAGVYTNQMIDTVSFENAHGMGEALRATGFQMRFEEIVSHYAATAKLQGPEILENLDAEAIAGHADELGKLFEKGVRSELLGYRTQGWKAARRDLFRSGADIAKDIGNATIPIVSNITAVYDGFVHAGEGLAAANQLLDMRDIGRQMAEARKRREREMREMIERHCPDGNRKTALLDGVGLLSDLYGRAVTRA